MLEERIGRNIMIGGNDKFDLKNKQNVGECIILKCKGSKSLVVEGKEKKYVWRLLLEIWS
jgi:hypothetical protein